MQQIEGATDSREIANEIKVLTKMGEIENTAKIKLHAETCLETRLSC
jgi:hypothetical protein